MSVNYLRISITDRCNLRCFYCMPADGIELKEHSEIMSYEDIYKVAKIASNLGIDKIRITGGEPLVRIGIEELIKLLKSINGIKEVSMTTNGTLLFDKAKMLKESGLDRVNISLDTLNDKQYEIITGKNYFNTVIKSIKEAKEYDLNPVKINTVIIKGYNDNQIEKFLNFMDEYDIVLRFIEYMPIGRGKNKDNHISLKEIIDEIKKKHTIEPIEVLGNGPAAYYKIKGYKGKIGFISPFTHNFCENCNRLRLTADGKIRTCLLKDEEINLYSESKLKTEDEIKDIFIKSIKSKKPHFGYESVLKDNNKSMHSIGG